MTWGKMPLPFWINKPSYNAHRTSVKTKAHAAVSALRNGATYRAINRAATGRAMCIFNA